MFNDFLPYIIVIGIFITIFKTPFVKGIIGEFIVNFISSICLDMKKYKLIKNVTLPTDDGSTQIDHIIVSRYGIFVVETKNMKGWIFGGPKQKRWTQVIFKSKTKFQNPLHQNYKHLKTLEKLLDLPADCFFSVIVFTGECTFKTTMPDNVVYPLGYIKFVKSKIIHKLDAGQVDRIVKDIEEERFDRSLKTHINHVNHVNDIVKTKKNYCPRCGNSLLLKTNRKGPNVGSQFLCPERNLT